MDTTPGSMSPLVTRVLDTARSRLGQHEQGGQNKGPIVEEVCQPFLDEEEFRIEYEAGRLQWCAAFACFCWTLAWPGFKKHASLSTGRLYAKLYALGWTWLASDTGKVPQPGDIVLFVHRPLPGVGPDAEPAPPQFRHTGLCRGYEGGASVGKLLTIEGNASGGVGDTGSVRERTYHLPDSGIYAFARVAPP